MLFLIGKEGPHLVMRRCKMVEWKEEMRERLRSVLCGGYQDVVRFNQPGDLEIRSEGVGVPVRRAGVDP